jgi:uncharacterized membrane protein
MAPKQMNTNLALTHRPNNSVRAAARWASMLAGVVACAATALAEPHYALTELATPAGCDFSVAWQINDQGYVAGYSNRLAAPAGFTATIWKNGTPTMLGRLKDGTYSMATAINSKGIAAGEGDDGDGRPLGCVSSGSKLVNFFSNNGGNTHPVAINEAGDTVSGYYINFSGTWRGAIWKIDPKDPRKSVKTDLPIEPGAPTANASAIPFAFNKSNEAAGWYANSSGQHAAFWKSDAAHTLVDLGVFGSDWSSEASDLNDLGQVVGCSHPPFGSRPTLWNNDAAHTAYELPLLPGDNYGNATLINNQGTMVGWSAASEPGTWNVTPGRIVVWVGGIVYDLQSLVDATAPGWKISQIMDVNNLGQLCGIAMRDGVTRAVVLTPAP